MKQERFLEKGEDNLFLDAGRKDVDVAETVVTSQTLQTFIFKLIFCSTESNSK